MPFDVYHHLIESFSPFAFKKVLDDKVLYDWLLPNVRLPNRYYSSCNDVIYKYIDGGKLKFTSETCFLLLPILTIV